MSLPEGVTESEPVRLFLQAGQSDCKGQASARLLRLNNETYPDIVGTVDGVWFAGLYDSNDEFLIRPMLAGEASEKFNFGPEVSLGERLVDASTGSSPIMIVKYCSGGTNVRTQWNPESTDNSWDRNIDDGSATWMLDNDLIDFADKKKLYANFIYVIRKTVETLETASIPYEFSGFFWIQGAADKGSTWQQYGDDLIRLFESVRMDLEEPFLPIVDKSGSPHHNIQTGKVYAASAISNANATTIGYTMSVADPESCCIPGPTNPCTGSSFVNFDLFEYYGYDPAFDEEDKPENATEKEFYWFKEFPTNQHFEFDGMVLRGRMLANAYIRSFSPSWANLTSEFETDDPSIIFPLNECSSEADLSGENVCWINLQNVTLEPLDCPVGGCGVKCLFNRLLGLLKRFLSFLRSLINSSK